MNSHRLGDRSFTIAGGVSLEQPIPLHLRDYEPTLLEFRRLLSFFSALTLLVGSFDRKTRPRYDL